MSGGAMRVALAAVLAAVSAALALLCAQVALGGAFAESNPARALRWDPNNAQALAKESVALGNVAISDEAFSHAARLARKALLVDPLNDDALRMLALEAERLGKPQAALAMMSQIGRRTRRDTLAQAWMMNNAFEHGRYVEGFRYADVILQRGPAAWDAVYPAMAATFADPAARGPMYAAMATGPAWRPALLSELVEDATDLDALQTFFLKFKGAPKPLEDEETGLIVGRLIADGRLNDARAVWRRLLTEAPPAAGEVYDGDFRGAPGAPPFNWGLASDASTVAERVEAPDGSPALYVRFPASEPTPLAEELLVLPPGNYVLSGRVLYGPRKPERLAWGLQCADGERLELSDLRQSDLPAKWRGFEADFTVPATGCAGQWLQLGSQAEEDFGMVDAWFTDMAVRPAAGRQAEAGAS